MLEHSINWKRAIFVDEAIDDDLVRKLTPTILALRQESNDPITVGIDSPGGSLASLDILLGLLTGPNQGASKNGCIVTVATNRAYSAAANFLAFGDYSVALKHSQVLYHDVRYGGMEDVTPEKARNAAKSLQELNDSFSLRLARKIIRRLLWIYIDLNSEFDTINKAFPKTFKRFDEAVSLFAPRVEGQHSVDIASFATALFAKVSRENDGLISSVMDRLSRWIMLTKLAESVPAYRAKRSRIPGLLDGARHLNKILNGNSLSFETSEVHLKLLMTLLISEIANTNTSRKPFAGTLEKATREFLLFQSMNDSKHQKSAHTLMLQHDLTFFGRNISAELEGKSEEEQLSLLSTAAPHARLFWLFCVSLCRELFEGEHILKSNDAQLLGLVDEVAGGGPIQSRREFRMSQEKLKEAEAEAAVAAAAAAAEAAAAGTATLGE